MVKFILDDWLRMPWLTSNILSMFCVRNFSILVTAFGGTAVAFVCFSAAATVAKRREYLYLGGLLSAGVSILFWLHFTSAIFGGSMAIFKFEVNV